MRTEPPQALKQLARKRSLRSSAVSTLGASAIVGAGGGDGGALTAAIIITTKPPMIHAPAPFAFDANRTAKAG